LPTGEPPSPAWTFTLALGVTLAICSGCAIHLQAPEPDLGRPPPLAPAPERSHISVVARLAHARLAAMVDGVRIEPIELGRDATLASWKLRVERKGRARVRAEGARLCLTLPFEGVGSVSWMGKRLAHKMPADVTVCARPELAADGRLRLRRPKAAVRLGRRTIARSTAILYEQLEDMLRARVGPMLSREVGKVAMPLVDVLRPVREALARPVPLPDGACLKLRPGQLRVGAPDVDPGFVRWSVSVIARPTVERPCTAGLARPSDIDLKVAPGLVHPQTRLRLPVGIALAAIEGELARKLKAKGRIRTQQGWVQITDLKLATSGSAVLAKAAIQGEVISRWLGMDWHRKVSGNVLLWGRPEAGKEKIGLQKIHLAVQTDDALADLAVALRRERLQEIARAHLLWPRRSVESRARRLLAGLAKPLKISGQHVPLKVTTHKMAIAGVRAQKGRIEIDFDFVGYLVLGDTARK